MRVLAVDYGTRGVGLAICDELRITVRWLAALRVAGLKREEIAARIADTADEYNVETIVVGLPLRMDGTRGDAARRVARFIEALRRRTPAAVVEWDERLTSRAADERLRERGADRRKRREMSDATAAVIILEDYLAENERRNAIAARDYVARPDTDS